MSTNTTFRCATCDELHELPFAYGTDSPEYWQGEGVLGEEQCEIGEFRFVRGRIVLPVVDSPETFEWGVWASLSEGAYDRMVELWDTPGREEEPPAFGWLASAIPIYEPSTLNLKTMVHTSPLGQRPLIQLEPTEHPLAVEQLQGITLERVREIARRLLHPQG